MKRVDDLTRRILLAMRDNPGPLPVTKLDGVDQAVFNEHVRLLKEDGLIDADLQIGQQDRVLTALARRLTARGQDFVQNH